MMRFDSRPGGAVWVFAVVLLIACWLSAGALPLVNALAGARAPVDWAHDYVTARVRLEDGRGALPPAGEAANERAAALGAPRVHLVDIPYSIHPPPAVVAVLPLARLPWHAAALAWAAGSALALGWLAFSLVGLYRPDCPPRPTAVAATALALCLWPPTLHCFEKGQWSIWLAALLAAGGRALEDGRARRAGLLFGVAAALKATPLVLLGLLFARHRRAAAAMVATVATAALLALAVDGVAPWRSFLVEAPRAAAAWATGPSNTASLNGLYARLFTEGAFSRPLVVLPTLARAAWLASALTLLMMALLRLRRPAPDPAARGHTVAAWLTLPVLLNPLGWTHVLLLLLAPLAIAARHATPARRALLLALAALFSLPRERLLLWATGGAPHLPVPPAGGLVLAVHAVAAVALFVLVLFPGSTSRPSAR